MLHYLIAYIKTSLEIDTGRQNKGFILVIKNYKQLHVSTLEHFFAESVGTVEKD